GVADLPRTGGAAELAHRFADIVHHEDERLRELSAARVDRQLAADLDPPPLDERSSFTTLAEAQILELLDDHRGEVVVEGDEVDVGRREPRHGEGPRRRVNRRGGEVVSTQARVLTVLAAV